MNTQANFNRVFDSELENCLLLIKALAEDMKFLMYSTRGYNTEHRETSASRSAAVVEDAVSFVRFPLLQMLLWEPWWGAGRACALAAAEKPSVTTRATHGTDAFPPAHSAAGEQDHSRNNHSTALLSQHYRLLPQFKRSGGPAPQFGNGGRCLCSFPSSLLYRTAPQGTLSRSAG